MSNEQWESFRDVFAVLDKSLEARNGVRIAFESKEKATTYVHRIYRARIADRQLSKETNPPEDANYGVSKYDGLGVRRESSKVIIIADFAQLSGIIKVEEIQ